MTWEIFTLFFITRIGAIFRELQSIQVTVREHDSSVMKYINTVRTPQVNKFMVGLLAKMHNGGAV